MPTARRRVESVLAHLFLGWFWPRPALSMRGQRRDRFAWFPPTHGPAKGQSPRDLRRLGVIPWRRRAVRHAGIRASFAGKHSFSAPAPHGARASVERHQRSRVHRAYWGTAFWNLLRLAPGSTLGGPQPWV